MLAELKKRYNDFLSWSVNFYVYYIKSRRCFFKILLIMYGGPIPKTIKGKIIT